jgi:hypothetical protein
LKSTQIEDFDAVEEAFKLLDVEGKGYLTVDTFKEIFKNLDLGEIARSDEDIFKEVADFDGDGYINLSDFRQILTYKPGEDKEQVIDGDQPIEELENEKNLAISSTTRHYRSFKHVHISSPSCSAPRTNHLILDNASQVRSH